MKIQNRRDKRIIDVTIEQWDNLKKIGSSHKWTVIDNSDLTVSKVAVPMEIEEFIKQNKKTKTNPK